MNEPIPPAAHERTADPAHPPPSARAKRKRRKLQAEAREDYGYCGRARAPASGDPIEWLLSEEPAVVLRLVEAVG